MSKFQVGDKVPMTEQVRAAYGANAWDYSHPEDSETDEFGTTHNHGRPGYEKFDRWLNMERARVWDEGWQAGYESGEVDGDPGADANPYRGQSNG